MKQVIAWKSDDGTLHEDEMNAFEADLEYWKRPLVSPKKEELPCPVIDRKKELEHCA